MRVIGIDIGGTNIDIVFFDNEFFKVSTYSTVKYFDEIYNLIETLISKYKADGVGVSVAAWIKSDEFIHAPNLPKIPKLPRKINKVPILAENDANCFALYASHVFGVKNIIGITVGTGIGSGIVINGKIYRGGGLAGEIGHWTIKNKFHKKCVCGGFNHLECHFGGWRFEEIGGAEKLVKSGEIYRLDGFDVFCSCVANAIMLLDPEAVVFGGRIGMNLEKNRLRRGIMKYLMHGFKPRIEILKDELAAAKGACLVVFDRLKR